MSKNNCIYNVVVYVGDFNSHDRRTIYTCSKQSKAEQFLHDYCKDHEEVTKAYIERSYGREALRRCNHDYEED